MSDMNLNYFSRRSSDPVLLRVFPVMMLSSVLAIIFLLMRMGYTASFAFLFLGWNLFLAWIPFVVSLSFRKESRMKWWLKGALFIVWLLFFPNAPYLLTDLVHLKPRTGIPLWYDLMLILSFAWNGLMLGFASLYNIHAFIREIAGALKAWILVIGLLILCGFGIYLGRFLRWNSWDMLINPIDVLNDSLHIIMHPFENIQSLGFTLIFSLFLVVSYLTLLVLIRPDEKGP